MTTIDQFLETDYETVPVTAGVEKLKQCCANHDCVMISDSDGRLLGLLTCDDIPENAVTAADCNFTKPFVASGAGLVNAATLMKSSGCTMLPVMKDGNIIGVVKAVNINYPMAEELNKYQLLFRHFTHDLRNAIGNIGGTLNLLEESIVKPDNLELLHYGTTSCKQAMGMLDEMLEAERKEQQESAFEITELSDFMANSVEQLKGTFATKELKVDVRLANKVFLAKIDRRHIQRVFHNVVSNAVKFSRPGDKIIIKSAVSAGSYKLSVEDFGIGIPLALQPLVFDQFTPAQRKGTAGENSTGLGLYFAKKTVKSHGGRIWLESTEGAGTTFHIVLPGV